MSDRGLDRKAFGILPRLHIFGIADNIKLLLMNDMKKSETEQIMHTNT